MSKYQQFIFRRYAYDSTTGTAQFYYAYDDELEFCETYVFETRVAPTDGASLDRALQLLFFMAGVSYYKMYLAPEIVVEMGQIDASLASFLSETYQSGLGEFFYINKLDPRTPVTFPVTISTLEPLCPEGLSGLLIGLGGGKDSLVTTELLRDQPKIATWSLNHRAQLSPLVERIGLEHFWVSRTWDAQIAQLNALDALNGHVPISAIFSCVGLIVALLSGYRYTLVSNESSASEPTLHYQGLAINHQYSKSLAYEQNFHATLNKLFGDSIGYYSFLRPFSELRIAELFANVGFEKYKSVFSSCNRAFTHDQHKLSWCGVCAKCAFVFLILTPFIDQTELESLWSGKNLLLDPSLSTTYRQLLGIEGDKPFDCVGEVKEARAAMRLAQSIYPELADYHFDIPSDYDFRAWSPDALAPNLRAILHAKLT